MRPTIVVALATALVMSAALASPAPALADETPAEPLTYVALGDSFAAGAGVPNPDPTVPLCWRSAGNYPHLVASAIGADLTDATCSNAETKHLTTAQYPMGAPPQLAALSTDTDLVTISIGGNDGNTFVGAISSCAAVSVFTFGLGSPCKAAFGTSFEDSVQNTTYPAVKAALQSIHAKAPNATVAIVGYPWLLPPTQGCYPVMPIAAGDVPYLRSLQRKLNAVIAQAAAETDSLYVDMSVVSEGHDACKSLATRWIEPVVTGLQPVPAHPNAAGQAAMAAEVKSVLGLP